MKVLFLVPYPPGESPSQRFRFEQYMETLEAAGISTRIQSFWDLQTWRILYSPGHHTGKAIGILRGVVRRIKSVFMAADFDLIFIHRECTPLGPPVFEWLLAKVLRKKIIYDFDDAIWLPNTSDENKIASVLKWHGKVSAICRWSYRISCGNDYLADFARRFNKNVVVNPTTIDTEHLHNPAHYAPHAASESVVIGWTGTHSTLKYLDPLVPVFQRLEKKYPGRIQFLVIANKAPQLALQHLIFLPWKKETEIQDLLRMDIGIMPLTDDIWAKGKCGFKALQYMALGIPTVTSPVGINTTMVDPAVGFLAGTPGEWEMYLEKLMDAPTLRKQMGAAGRKKVIDQYSVGSNTSTFLSLFE
ncbi:glycosyltransferase [Chryseolinea soli]|uniref:Glycosyltransferase n=1 Tax=Chryseolinea soli TaxID=2321403 RepID=A0A385SX30_9BACT|nr:glycosyltransferase [Chryseolinea soli]